MMQTEVLSGQGWDLGEDVGKLSADGKRISGTGKDPLFIAWNNLSVVVHEEVERRRRWLIRVQGCFNPGNLIDPDSC